MFDSRCLGAVHTSNISRSRSLEEPKKVHTDLDIGGFPAPPEIYRLPRYKERLESYAITLISIFVKAYNQEFILGNISRNLSFVP